MLSAAIQLVYNPVKPLKINSNQGLPFGYQYVKFHNKSPSISSRLKQKASSKTQTGFFESVCPCYFCPCYFLKEKNLKMHI
jgi:hypothetical protein